MSDRVPFFDLQLQHRQLEKEIQSSIMAVFEASSFSGGPEVQRFESEFAAYCGVSDAVGVNSGTDALHLALLSVGVGPGDEVITTPMTFVATAAAIEYCGAKPVFVDCDPRTFTIDVNKIADVITCKTKVIIPVHLHGRLVDMAAINEIAARSNLMVIEDAAQAHGASRNGRRAGAWGSIGCFSFYPSKNLGACGEAGALITSDGEVARKARMLRNWGSEERYLHKFKGFNYRMDGLQAAILRVKLRYLDEWNTSRKAFANRYREQLKDLDLVLPAPSDNEGHVYHVFSIRTPRRNELQKWLTARDIGSSIHYPIPVHLQEAYCSPEYPRGSMPVCEQIADEILSLPLFPEMTNDMVDRTCDEIRSFYRNAS